TRRDDRIQGRRARPLGPLHEARLNLRADPVVREIAKGVFGKPGIDILRNVEWAAGLITDVQCVALTSWQILTHRNGMDVTPRSSIVAQRHAFSGRNNGAGG